MSNVIQQINITYVPEQDRLLMKANVNGDEEFRLWLTRRYCILLSRVLDECIVKAGGMQTVSSQQETLQQIRQGAFEKHYSADTARRFPLGEEGILGYSINSGKNPDGGFTLQLLPEQGQGLNFVLDDAMLYLMHNLLEQAVLTAGWNIESSSPTRKAMH